MWRDGLGVMDQSLGHSNLEIHPDSIIFYGTSQEGHFEDDMETPTDSDDDLIDRIYIVAAHVHEIPRRVRKLHHRRCQAYIFVGGRNIEQIL